MPSPQRSPRHSPKRRPLHERSDSQANEGASPTLRLVREPQANLKISTPFPTHPSHVLLPKNGSSQDLGPQVFEDEGEGFQTEGLAYALESQGQGLSKGKDTETDASGNNHGSSVRPLSIGNPLPITVPPLNFNPPQSQSAASHAQRHSVEMDRDIANVAPSSSEIIRLPSVSNTTETPEPYPANQTSVSSQQPIGSKASEGSLSSSGSTGTVVHHKIRPRRASYSAFPPSSRPASSKSILPPSTPQRYISHSSVDDSPETPISTTSSFFPTPEIHHATAVPTGSRAHRVTSDSFDFQFPVVKPPTASGSWAESSTSIPNATPRRPHRAMQRDSGRWNPHLSTVQSENIEEKENGTMWIADSADMSASSLDANNMLDTSQLPARPPPALSQHRDLTDLTVRIVNESQDNVSNLLSPIPGSRGSGFYSIFSRESRSFRRSGGQARPASRGSFFRDSIPAWARYYYTRGGSALALPQVATPGASAESLGVLRPQTRPQGPAGNQVNRDSMAISPANPQDLNPLQTHDDPRTKPVQVWSPHLWHDRRTFGKHRSIFKAPSLDEHAEGPYSKRNIQVLLFTIGFIFPIGWFIASVFPLPPKPSSALVAPFAREQAPHDLEKTFGIVDEARYENARWWRNLNRFMSLIGVLIIVAIVSQNFLG
ncbi:MAG: hypothetical protein Q9167_001729 [Letrouitia subvulpina]